MLQLLRWRKSRSRPIPQSESERVEVDALLASRSPNRMVFLFDSSGTENAEAGSGMGVELLVDFGVGDVGKVLG